MILGIYIYLFFNPSAALREVKHLHVFGGSLWSVPELVDIALNLGTAAVKLRGKGNQAEKN